MTIVGISIPRSRNSCSAEAPAPLFLSFKVHQEDIGLEIPHLLKQLPALDRLSLEAPRADSIA